MSAAEFLGTIISLCVFMLGTLLAVVWYLGGRIDARLDGLGGRVDGLSGRIDGLTGPIDGLNGRVDGLKDEVSAVRVDIGRIGRRLDDHLADHPGPATGARAAGR